jgi:hypothetical protein
MFAGSRRSFLTGGVAALLGILGWRWMPEETKARLFRRTFEFNEKVSKIFFDKNDLAPEFPIELASERVNGLIGLESDLEPDKWQLLVTGIYDPQKYRQYSSEMTFSVEKEAPRRLDSSPMEDVPVTGLLLSLDDIRSLPRIEMTTELKCIEGWSVIVNWTGARFSDFAARYFTGLTIGESPDLHNLPDSLTKYVSLVTPDHEYFVGWDIESILHPQTLLAYEMNGHPLTSEHGAPLRLVSTTKYGIKQLKRIGRIEFTDQRPRDYWAEFGYDWYSGH